MAYETPHPHDLQNVGPLASSLSHLLPWGEGTEKLPFPLPWGEGAGHVPTGEGSLCLRLRRAAPPYGEVNSPLQIPTATLSFSLDKG